MKTRDLAIDGMHCGHCVMSVRNELRKINGVIVQDVQIGTGHVQFDEVDEAGYKLTESK